MACDRRQAFGEFARGTTPTCVIRCKGVDLGGWSVFVTLEQGSYELTKDDVTVEVNEWGSLVRCQLSQDETLGFREGEVKAQVRAYRDGEAIASRKTYVSVAGVLLDGVISDV